MNFNTDFAEMQYEYCIFESAGEYPVQLGMGFLAPSVTTVPVIDLCAPLMQFYVPALRGFLATVRFFRFRSNAP